MRSKLDGNLTLSHPRPRKKPTTKQMTLSTLQTIAASLVAGVKLRNTNEESTGLGELSLFWDRRKNEQLEQLPSWRGG